jgi:hypothetical protein
MRPTHLLRLVPGAEDVEAVELSWAGDKTADGVVMQTTDLLYSVKQHLSDAGSLVWRVSVRIGQWSTCKLTGTCLRLVGQLPDSIRCPDGVERLVLRDTDLQ